MLYGENSFEIQTTLLVVNLYVNINENFMFETTWNLHLKNGFFSENFFSVRINVLLSNTVEKRKVASLANVYQYMVHNI